MTPSSSTSVRAVLVALCLALSPSAHAQDTRRIDAEPPLQPLCETVEAQRSLPLDQTPSTPEDTARIQQAMDRCAPGHTVALTTRGNFTAFLSGPVHLRPGVTLQIASGAILLASRNPRDYDLQPGSCGVVDDRGHGCKPLLDADDAPNSGLFGPGTIDGQGGATLLNQSISWWDLAQQAKRDNLQQSCPRLLVVHRSNGFNLVGITLRDSPNFHVVVNNTDGFTAWAVRIHAPATARNTDGIDPGSSRNVTIAHSFIHAGDDNIAIKAGSTGPAEYISILHNHFYTGHGMSIGSETNGGVRHILVDDLTIDGADNGFRIKSDSTRGGLVEDVLYRNVCIRDTKNPIVITPFYTAATGTLPPVYRRITLRDIHVLTPGRFTFQGLSPAQPASLTLDGVWANGMQGTFTDTSVTLGPAGTNLLPNHATSPTPCPLTFIPFP